MRNKIDVAVIQELQNLAVQGELKPERVVAAAIDESSPLHPFFEWDNDKAAHAHRLEQARALIRRVKVEVTINEEVYVVPRYVRDPLKSAGDAGYVETLSLKTDEDRAREVVLRELSSVVAHLERANKIAAVLDLSDEFAEMIEAAIRLRTKAMAAEEASEAG